MANFSTTIFGSFPQLIRSLQSDSKISVPMAQVSSALARTRTEDLLHCVGIGWKKTPVRILIRDRPSEEWDAIYNRANSFAKTLSEPGVARLGEYHNKIKHGPQLIVQTPSDIAARRGLDGIDSRIPIPRPETEHIRILLAGARTQRTDHEEANRVRVAPFLLHQPIENVVDRFFGTVFFGAVTMRLLAVWSYRTRFDAFPREDIDPAITEISEEWTKHTRRQFRP